MNAPVHETPPRRLFVLTALAVGLGFVSGGAAWVLVHLIGLLTNLALFHRFGWNLPSLRNLDPGPWLVLTAAAGAFVVSCLARWSPVIRGHGIPEAMESVLVRQSRIAPRAAVAKPLSAAVAIGTGGPFGAEGPIIVTGGALGSLLGQVIAVSAAERKILVASGAAAGMAATFGSPLAAVILALELLLFEFSARAFLPLIVASGVAAAVHGVLFEPGPLFAVPVHDGPGLGSLPLFVVLGVGCGLLAVGVSRGLFLFEAAFRRLPVKEFWHPVVGAVGFALVGLAVPRALSVGYDAITDVLLGRLAVGAVAVLFAAKLLAWWVALASGTSGGTLAPLLLVGASFGSMVGVAAGHIDPGLSVSPGVFALVAMAATFGAATRATFTSIVFVFELTGDYRVIVPLMVASVLADLVASALLPESIMTEKLARRGHRIGRHYEVDVLRTTGVRALMTTDVTSLRAGATVAEALDCLRASGHGAVPIVDRDQRCIGIVSLGDLFRQAPDESAPVMDVATPDPSTVAPDATALAALDLLLEQHITHLPVVEGGRLVGVCTRTDILRARQRQLEHERRQPGWAAARQLASRRR